MTLITLLSANRFNGKTVTQPPAVLSFSASDPSGGAGAQADLMTLSAMGCHPLSVITALTVQDTIGVDNVRAVEADWVEEQARALLEDMPVAAFKIGLLGSIDNIAIVVSIIADYPDIPLVLDPVLASGRGDVLTDEATVFALRELLLPHTTILTPNSLEVRQLVADDNETTRPLSDYAYCLIDYGCQHVLVTGTHENTPQVVNSLYNKDGLLRCDTWERLPGSYHGSGCTLASAIAANLAHGLPIDVAVFNAQSYTWQTLAAGYRPGMGQYIPDRFYWARARNEGNDA